MDQKKWMHGEENLVVRRRIPCYNIRVLNQNSSIEQFCWIYFTYTTILRLILGNRFFFIFNSLTII